MPPVPEVPTFRIERPEEEGDALLSLLRGIVTRYPLAVQAAVKALATEGRAFAETEEGRAWRDRLCRSSLIARLRILWEGITEEGFSVDDQGVIPTVVMDRIVQTAMSSGLEQLLCSFFERRTEP